MSDKPVAKLWSKSDIESDIEERIEKVLRSDEKLWSVTVPPL